MHNSGMLIHHWAANLSPHRDIDILSAMFVILKDFVRDSFREKSGGLTEFQFGDSRVFLAEGHRSILAAVVRGKHVNGLPGQFAAAVQDFERRSSEVLADWSGQLDVLYRRGERWVVADYKSDRDERTERHRPQADVYTRAAQRALGLAAPPEFRLIYLRTGRAIRL